MPGFRGPSKLFYCAERKNRLLGQFGSILDGQIDAVRVAQALVVRRRLVH